MMPDTAAEDTGRHLTTLPGWRQFAVDPPAPAALSTAAEYAALPAPDKYLYDETRLDHHARLLVVATSAVRHTVATGRRLVVLNRHAISARRGLIVSGPAERGRPSRSPSSAWRTNSSTAPATPMPRTGSRSSTSPSHPPRPPA